MTGFAAYRLRTLLAINSGSVPPQTRASIEYLAVSLGALRVASLLYGPPGAFSTTYPAYLLKVPKAASLLYSPPGAFSATYSAYLLKVPKAALHTTTNTVTVPVASVYQAYRARLRTAIKGSIGARGFTFRAVGFKRFSLKVATWIPVPHVEIVPAPSNFVAHSLKPLQSELLAVARLPAIIYMYKTGEAALIDEILHITTCTSLDESVIIEATAYTTADEALILGKSVSCDMEVGLTICKSTDEIIFLEKMSAGLLDETVSLSRNYLGFAGTDEIIVILPRYELDEVIILTATPTIVSLDETLVTMKSSGAETDETIVLTMTYTYPPEHPLHSMTIDVDLSNQVLDMVIALTKTEVDEVITITSQHNIPLLGDVIRDSDQRAKGIIVYAGQDIVLEE